MTRKTIRWQTIIAAGALVCGMTLTSVLAQQAPIPPAATTAQSNQTATAANDATTLGDPVPIASSEPPTKLAQKKPLASMQNKLIAERSKAWAKELKPVSTTASNESEQQKPAAPEQGDAAELAKKLANPLASLISVPFQNNVDMKMAAGNGWRYTLNLQPVVPIALNPHWNLISRTIIPFIHQSNVSSNGATENGLGDIVQSFFFSPNKSEPFIWGVGPVILVPMATNQFLGGKQLGLGPTVVVLSSNMDGPSACCGTISGEWRAGVAGRVNADFIQPFLTYGTRDGWTYAVNTESTYNWTGNNWSVPIHATVGKLVRFGKQPIQFAGGLRCWVTTPSGGPEGCGLRMVVTALFPKK